MTVVGPSVKIRGMPRVARSISTGCPYHVMNRGNGRATLFHKAGDYDAFCRVLTEGLGRHSVDLFAFCLMPNHWHLLLSEREAGQLSAFMSWVGVTHVRRHHEHYHTRGSGHLYQGRFKSFPVASGPYFRSIAQYVEANALRAKLCKRAEAWPWTSAAPLPKVPLGRWPWTRPGDWLVQLNEPIAPKGLATLRQSAIKGRPFGPSDWIVRTSDEQRLTHTLRDAGRPRKSLAALRRAGNQ